MILGSGVGFVVGSEVMIPFSSLQDVNAQHSSSLLQGMMCMGIISCKKKLGMEHKMKGI